MIIKVPTYVEIDYAPGKEDLELFVSHLQEEFYKHLRKKNFEKILTEMSKDNVGTYPQDIKILSVAEAFDILRKRK